jgi:formylglycine-generating enzyme required for sulfatase activity
MGSDPAKDPNAQPNEQPQHQVCITKGFWLDQYEVTNAAYQQFIEDGGYTQREFWSESGWQWKGNRTQPQETQGFVEPQQPRVGIHWYEAEAYARWRGGRSPTEAEWEYAARGPKSTLYPWGDVYEVGRANVNETSVGGQWRERSLPVGSFENGKSWVGAYDMAGNVWEWTSTWYNSTSYQQRPKDDPQDPDRGELRVARGGSWYLDPINARSVTRRDRPFVLETVSGIRVVHGVP